MSPRCALPQHRERLLWYPGDLDTDHGATVAPPLPNDKRFTAAMSSADPKGLSSTVSSRGSSDERTDRECRERSADRGGTGDRPGPCPGVLRRSVGIRDQGGRAAG